MNIIQHQRRGRVKPQHLRPVRKQPLPVSDLLHTGFQIGMAFFLVGLIVYLIVTA